MEEGGRAGLWMGDGCMAVGQGILAALRRGLGCSGEMMMVGWCPRVSVDAARGSKGGKMRSGDGDGVSAAGWEDGEEG